MGSFELVSIKNGPVEAVTDEELARRLALGDRAALATLVERWEAPIFRTALRIVGNAQDAEEIRQVVFLKLIERGTSDCVPNCFAAWIRRTTVNAAITEARRKSRHRSLLVRFVRPHAIYNVDARATCAANEEAELLRLALQRLKPADRAILALRFEEDSTMQEIAEALARPLGTVKWQLQQAVKRLRTAYRRTAEGTLP